jgi:phosphoribosylaminoimidazolecarboxamide formyltransferase/IMP cyclohydrolase
MIRAAAKNYNSVIVVVDPADYEWIVEQLSDGDILEKDRFNLAAKAFRATANYDTMIANEFEACADEGKLLKDGGKH